MKVKELDLSQLESCLLDEDPDIRELPVKLKGGAVTFRIRPLTDGERSQARAEASTGESVTSWEATPAAIEQYAKEIGKEAKKLSVREVLEAGRKYGNKSVKDSMDYEKFNALTVFYALGGAKRFGNEGWDLATRGGEAVPITVDNVRGRLHPDVLDALSALASKSRAEAGEAEVRN
jgi:hypothetical protein